MQHSVKWNISLPTHLLALIIRYNSNMKLQVLKKYPSIRHFNFPCTYIVSGSYSYCFSHEVFSEPHQRKFITLGKLIEMKWDVDSGISYICRRLDVVTRFAPNPVTYLWSWLQSFVLWWITKFSPGSNVILYLADRYRFLMNHTIYFIMLNIFHWTVFCALLALKLLQICLNMFLDT